MHPTDSIEDDADFNYARASDLFDKNPRLALKKR